MTELKSGIVLAEGETLVMELKAGFWLPSSSFNPIVIVMLAIMKFITMIIGFILGVRTKMFLVITDRRVIEVSEQIIWWCIPIGRSLTYVTPDSVKEVGFIKKKRFWCFCPIYCLYYASLTRRSAFKMIGADEATVLKTVDVFYAAVGHAKG